MASSIEEEVNYTSLIELFGTFFEKVTNSHPQKESLNKHLSDFKRMLYTNKSNLQPVETYLEDLKKKAQPSAQSIVKSLASEQLTASETKKISPKAEVTRSTRRYKTFGPETSRASTKSHKFETIGVANFIKNRSLEHSNQKQSLLNKYSHIYEFELDSSNFYRLIAVGTIMHLICTSESSSKLSEIIDDVATHKIALKNYYYSYSHEEYANVFCGYIEQILAVKKEGKSSQAILQLFQDMVKYDHLFNIALLCYLKGKLIQFVTEQLPKGAWNNQTAWEQLHSPDITEKILNNNPMVFESLLHILPFLLNLRIFTQITENGTLYEKSYSKKTLGAVDSSSVHPSSDSFGQAIHLLVEKIFTTSNFYLLVPSESKPVNTTTLAPQLSNRAIIEDIKQKYSTKASLKATPRENSATSGAYQSLNPTATEITRRHIGIEGSVLSDHGNLSPGKNPLLNGMKSPRFFMTPSKLKGSDSTSDDIKDAPHSEKKKKVTEYSEIVNGSLAYQLERSNGKENKITFEKKSPQRRKVSEFTDRSYTTSVPVSRTSLPSARISPQSISTRGSEKSFPDQKDDISFSVRQVETEESVFQRRNTLSQFESPYDLYIKTKSQQSIATSRPIVDEKTTVLPSKSGSVAYSGNPFNSTPYDNYVSSYNYPNQNNQPSSTRLLPSQTHTLSADPSDLSQKTALSSNSSMMTNATTSYLPTSVKTTSSDSSTIETIKKFTKLSGDYPSLSHENYSFSLAAENDQGLRDRLKNIGTLAPKTNDSTPANPFSQLSAKNITTMGAVNQYSQDAASPYKFQHGRYNLDAKALSSYGVPYYQTQDAKTSAKTAQTSTKTSINENFQSFLPSGVSYSYKITQNVTMHSSQSSRYGVNQGPVSGDNNFTNNSLY